MFSHENISLFQLQGELHITSKSPNHSYFSKDNKYRLFSKLGEILFNPVKIVLDSSPDSILLTISSITFGNYSQSSFNAVFFTCNKLVKFINENSPYVLIS